MSERRTIRSRVRTAMVGIKPSGIQDAFANLLTIKPVDVS